MKAGWEVKPLGEVANIQSGFAFKSADYCDDGHFLVRIGNVQDGELVLDSPKYVALDEKTKRFELAEGDILTSLTGNIGRVASVEEAHLPAALNQRVARLLPRDNATLDVGYFLYFLYSDGFGHELRNLSHGAAQQNVSPKFIANLAIPIPPIEEQKRIVAVLDAAFEGLTRAKENAEANLQNARELFEGVLADALRDLEREYGCLQLSDHADFRNGFAFKSARFSDEGEPIVRISNIQSGEVDMAKAVFTKRDVYSEDLTKYEVQPDDLLIAMSGATTGKVGFNKTGLTLLQNQRVGRFCPTETLLLPYLYFVLTTKIEEHLAISAGAAQPNLSTKQIGDIQLPVPPIDDQSLFLQHIGKLADSADDLARAYRAKLTDIADLRQSLLQKAFAGELT